MNNTILCFVAGRSGGHIVPALTLAQQAKKEFPETKIHFFTTKSSLDISIMATASIIDMHRALPLKGVPRNPFKLFFWIAACVASFAICLKHFLKHKPTQVISMGGYVSLPVCVAAWVLRIPIELYELNAVPGKASKVLARFATDIAVCFETTQAYFTTNKCSFVPYPIRFTYDAPMSTQQALEAIGFTPYRKTILIIGGSQGSQCINTTIENWLSLNEYAHSLIQVIHQTGSKATTDWNKLYASYDIPAITFDYNDTMHAYYQAADIIICRSGAGSLFEAVYFNKKIITIPLRTRSTSHQIDNAKAMAQRYPHLVTILDEAQVKKNNTIFFSAINSYIYEHQAASIKKDIIQKNI